MTSIFRTVAFVGDNLSSGEFETFDPEKNERHYHDMFEYSWGQFAARMAGFTAYNFSRGGMTASEYCDSYVAAMARMAGKGIRFAMDAEGLGTKEEMLALLDG